MRSHRNLNPYPNVVSNRVWHLLFVWAEWRSVRSCPRSPRPPEAAFRWRVKQGAVIGEPGICLASSTAPKDPGVMDVFNQAMVDLAEDQREVSCGGGGKTE